MITAREAGLVACQVCARVWPAGQSHCTRCGSRLRSRDETSLQRVWAWWFAGVLCYIPANVTPMLITRTLISKQDNTIIGGAVEIARHGDVLIALIVLVASVMIPVGKFIAIAYLALTLRRGTIQSAHGRQVMYEVVDFIGRWSMIDVFVVAILSSLVQLSVVASIRPGPAALTFAMSVIFTMLSAQSFDSRLIWDTARRDPSAGPDTPDAPTAGPDTPVDTPAAPMAGPVIPTNAPAAPTAGHGTLAATPIAPTAGPDTAAEAGGATARPAHRTAPQTDSAPAPTAPREGHTA